jgi:hypothetical protein
MKRRQHGRGLLGKIAVEIQAVKMDQVDWVSFERFLDAGQVHTLRLLTNIVRNLAFGYRTLDELSGRFRSLSSNDHRAVTGINEPLLDEGENLFRAAARIGPNRQERIGDAKNGHPGARAAHSLRCPISAVTDVVRIGQIGQNDSAEF